MKINPSENLLDEILDSKPEKVDFSEYMWMENEEEFDNEVMKQLEEEALMEQCIEAMLEDEMQEEEAAAAAYMKNIDDFTSMSDERKADLVKKSTLNPNAAEFVPGS